MCRIVWLRFEFCGDTQCWVRYSWWKFGGTPYYYFGEVEFEGLKNSQTSHLHLGICRPKNPQVFLTESSPAFPRLLAKHTTFVCVKVEAGIFNHTIFTPPTCALGANPGAKAANSELAPSSWASSLRFREAKASGFPKLSNWAGSGSKNLPKNLLIRICLGEFVLFLWIPSLNLLWMDDFFFILASLRLTLLGCLKAA